ncbi:MAG: ABC transporter permease subunit [Proteobacteria bacterium]|nr:ABC transporter permease subunit [Pseudomonadota bacterium]
MIPTVFGISCVMFALTQIMPGGPIDRIVQRVKFGSMGSSGTDSGGISEDFHQALIAHYGYDKPPVARYFHWVGSVLRGDLGESFEYEEPVLKVIVSKFPVSLTFGLFSFFLVYLLSIPLGIYKAYTHGKWFDSMSSFLLFVAHSIPSFILAIALLVIFAGGSYFNIFPAGGLVSDDFHELSLVAKIKDYFHHIFLPLTAYVAGQFALSTLLMKDAFLEQKTKAYVLTARAKGLSEVMIAYRHILRNSLTPMATQISEFTAVFLMGSVLIEQIFNLDGVGLLSYDSILSRDYPVVMGIILLAAFAQVIGVLISDLLYVLLDPRVSYKSSLQELS